MINIPIDLYERYMDGFLRSLETELVFERILNKHEVFVKERPTKAVIFKNTKGECQMMEIDKTILIDILNGDIDSDYREFMLNLLEEIDKKEFIISKMEQENKNIKEENEILSDGIHPEYVKREQAWKDGFRASQQRENQFKDKIAQLELENKMLKNK